MIEMELARWLSKSFPRHELSPPKLVAGDASPRRYYRVDTRIDADHRTLIAAISPPTEKNAEFVAARQLLADAGVRVPALYAADLDRGFLALEDLGDCTLLPLLSDETVAGFYGEALQNLRDLARLESTHIALPNYAPALLQAEMDVFVDWFVKQLVTEGHDGPRLTGFEAVFGGMSEILIRSALSQPQVLVHRDFHSRNLMVLPDKRLAVIDFQDAVIGPVTYDVVSLLKDCYVAWPREQQLLYLAQHRHLLIDGGLIEPVSETDFLRWFDLMGLQRHIKVLGVFARLCLRDDKPAYLADLPLVLHYIREAMAIYADDIPEIDAFQAWFCTDLMPFIVRQPWFRSTP